MFHQHLRFSKIINIIALAAMLSLSVTGAAYANTGDDPQHRRCRSDDDYQHDPRCQGYYGYQPCQGPGCAGDQGYSYHQGCEGAGCSGNQTPPALPSGTSPDNAQMLGSGSATVAAQAQQWYSFPVQPPLYGDNSRGTLNLDVTLTNLSGKASFQVLTSDLVNQWKNDVQYSPLGAGSDATSAQGQPILTWHGSFNVPLMLYVLVSNNTDQPATYTLNLRVSSG